MHYIVGLGNPGGEYEGTRHNVGFAVLDRWRDARGWSAPVPSKQYAGRIVEGSFAGSEVILLYPDTFMNNSGSAVKKLVPKGEEARLIVVYDDIDLALGEVKVSFGRGDGGHNGIKSIIASLGTKDFARVRVGIAAKSFWTGKPKRPQGSALTRHVLGKFRSGEVNELEQALERAIQVIESAIQTGVEETMNKFN